MSRKSNVISSVTLELNVNNESVPPIISDPTRAEMGLAATPNDQVDEGIFHWRTERVDGKYMNCERTFIGLFAW